MSDTLEIVTVRKNDGTRPSFQFDTTSKLSDIRIFLSDRRIMSSTDSFLLASGSDIARDQEGQIALSAILKDGELWVGLPSNLPGLDTQDNVARYNRLNDTQKRAIFENVEIFRGFAFNRDGFDRTYRNVYSWRPGYLPDATMPTTHTQVISELAFTKAMREVRTFSSDSTSMSISAPFASAEAEYKTEREKTTTSSKVTEYLMTKYIIRKVMLRVTPNNLVANPDFLSSVNAAIEKREYTSEAYYRLLSVLNEWGYYIPVEFALGGAVLGSDETSVAEYTEAEKEKEEFKASFKAEFDKIGGGAAYQSAHGSETTTSTTHKFQNIQTRVIGGASGLEKDYPKWAESLEPAINWGVPDIKKFWPTLLLLNGSNEGRRDLTFVIKLIERFASHPNAIKFLPYLDMQEYNTQMQVILNPYA